MDQRVHELEGVGGYIGHIWLRYSVQFTVDGRTHTLEMGIPMPIGASAELREQLLNEADAGMSQLSSHVESRVAHILEQAQSTHPAIPTIPAIPIPTPTVSPAVTPQHVPHPTPMTPTPMTAPTPQTTTQETVQATASTPPPQVRETIPEPVEVTVPPTRPTIGASMPVTVMTSEASGNLTIPEFIKLIHDSMGMTPKQAMATLNVRSLSGLNLRDALERLQQIVAQQSQQSAGSNRVRGAEGGTDAARSVGKPEKPAGIPADKNTLSSPPTTATPTVTAASRPAPLSGPPPAPAAETLPIQPVGSKSSHESQTTMVGEERPRVVFDEEINLDEERAPDNEPNDLEDLEESQELTAMERVRAMAIINRLRESRGANFANVARLQALDNVVGDQVSKEEFQELVVGIWGVPSLKKLKVDQVEALISWAKEDDFVNEVAAVLVLLEEENYARGNR